MREREQISSKKSVYVLLVGGLLHLHSYHRVPAQGELPLPGLSQPRVQQEGGRPTEWHVPL